HAHNVLQAACRGAIRNNDAERCPEANLYIITPKHIGLQALLPKIFPQCKIFEWKPIAKEAKGRVKEAIEIVSGWLESSEEPIPSHTVMRQMGIDDRANFKKNILQHPMFVGFMKEKGLEEFTTPNGHKYINRQQFG